MTEMRAGYGASGGGIIDLPWPPSLNHLYRRAGAPRLCKACGNTVQPVCPTCRAVLRGGTGLRLSAEGQAWKDEAIVYFRQCPQIERPLRIAVYVTPPDKRRRDIGNLEKLLGDSLSAAWDFDDRMGAGINEWHWYYTPDAKEEDGFVGLHVQIEHWENEP